MDLSKSPHFMVLAFPRTRTQHHGTRTRTRPIPPRRSRSSGSIESEHRDDPFKIRFAVTIFYISCIADSKHVMIGRTFKRRAACNFEEAILVLQALLAVAFRSV